MEWSKKKQPVRDILQEKVNEVAQLNQQATDAVDIVTRTMNVLDGINQRLGESISEIDAYTKELAATRDAMSKQQKHNAAIMSNFAKLLEVDAEESVKE